MNQIAPVQLSEPNSQWSKKFEEIKKELFEAIATHILFIEHIGSTAIPHLSAKPEIDIMIGVKNLENAQQCIQTLETIGYQYFKKFEEFVPERRYFRKSEGVTPLVHIHMVEVSSTFWSEHIFFRDYLRNHPDTARAYEKLKKELIESSAGDRNTYQKGKEDFIKKVLKICNVITMRSNSLNSRPPTLAPLEIKLVKDTEKAFHWIINILESRAIGYKISGGFAARVYGVNRALADIDIEIEDSDISKIVYDVKPYILSGPIRYKDENWDLARMTLAYEGQEIDITGTDARIFNQKKQWEDHFSNLESVETKVVFGRNVQIESLNSLIRYKSKLAREVDLEDIKQLAEIRKIIPI